MSQYRYASAERGEFPGNEVIKIAKHEPRPDGCHLAGHPSFELSRSKSCKLESRTDYDTN